jgi:hypothetical protein
VAPVTTRAKTTRLRDEELLGAFLSDYGNLDAATIAPGRYWLARHESSSRRLFRGELVVNEPSSLGYLYYSAETIAGTGTSGGFGHLRFERSTWNNYALDIYGKEFVSSGHQIKTDDDTIAWYTKGSNFEELRVWQKIIGDQAPDRYIARELTKMKTLVDELLAKRAAH